MSDMVGKKFGRLTVIRRSPKRGNCISWECRCDCGKEITTQGTSLRSGHTKSCGCYQREAVSAANTTHGLSRSDLFMVWAGMMERCYNPKARGYESYGGRGITVCKRWRIFDNFHKDMSPRPAGTTLDRIDNDKGYMPSNCRWATAQEQAENKRRNHVLMIDGVQYLTATSACRAAGVSQATFYRRVSRGMTPQDALDSLRGK